MLHLSKMMLNKYGYSTLNSRIQHCYKFFKRFDKHGLVFIKYYSNINCIVIYIKNGINQYKSLLRFKIKINNSILRSVLNFVQETIVPYAINEKEYEFKWYF